MKNLDDKIKQLEKEQADIEKVLMSIKCDLNSLRRQQFFEKHNIKIGDIVIDRKGKLLKFHKIGKVLEQKI